MSWKSRVCVALVGFASACGSSSFNGDNGTIPSRQLPAKAPPVLGDNATKAAPDGASPGLDVDASGRLNPCPSKPQKVLVLDFKSGWWAGDGGNFVERITDALTKSCGQVMTLEYHHLILAAPQNIIGALFNAQNPSAPITNMTLTAPGTQKLQAGATQFEQAFSDPTFASYTQIWLLSGSAADPADLKTNHAFFQRTVKAIASSKANLFIGVGYGSITHAAAVAEARGLKAGFSTAQPEGNILNPMGTVTLTNSLGADKIEEDHVLLKGLSSLADSMVVSGVPAHGDNIEDKGGIKVLATDKLGQKSLAVSTDETNGLRFVLDADLPRYYAAWTNQSPDTMKLLQNIMVFLAQ